MLLFTWIKTDFLRKVELGYYLSKTGHVQILKLKRKYISVALQTNFQADAAWRARVLTLVVKFEPVVSHQIYLIFHLLVWSNETVINCVKFDVKMDDGYDNQEWGESSGMRGDSEMGDVSFRFSWCFLWYKWYFAVNDSLCFSNVLPFSLTMRTNIWKILQKFWKNASKRSKHKTTSWNLVFSINWKGNCYNLNFEWKKQD